MKNSCLGIREQESAGRWRGWNERSRNSGKRNWWELYGEVAGNSGKVKALFNLLRGKMFLAKCFYPAVRLLAQAQGIVRDGKSKELAAVGRKGTEARHGMIDLSHDKLVGGCFGFTSAAGSMTGKDGVEKRFGYKAGEGLRKVSKKTNRRWFRQWEHLPEDSDVFKSTSVISKTLK